MDQQDIIGTIEERAAKLQLSMSEVCQQAGVHPTTFSRWKKSEKNPQPIGATIKSLSAITDVLDRMEAQKAAA
jgi:transcriptional regulator with XRE-family HTH domain